MCNIDAYEQTRATYGVDKPVVQYHYSDTLFWEINTLGVNIWDQPSVGWKPYIKAEDFVWSVKSYNMFSGTPTFVGVNDKLTVEVEPDWITSETMRNYGGYDYVMQRGSLLYAVTLRNPALPNTRYQIELTVSTNTSALDGCNYWGRASELDYQMLDLRLPKTTQESDVRWFTFTRQQGKVIVKLYAKQPGRCVADNLHQRCYYDQVGDPLRQSKGSVSMLLSFAPFHHNVTARPHFIMLNYTDYIDQSQICFEGGHSETVSWIKTMVPFISLLCVGVFMSLVALAVKSDQTTKTFELMYGSNNILEIHSDAAESYVHLDDQFNINTLDIFNESSDNDDYLSDDENEGNHGSTIESNPPTPTIIPIAYPFGSIRRYTSE
eukprot:gene17110-20380_t